MAGVEVDEWLWVLGIDPDLAYNAGVYRAHELLAEDIYTLGLRGVSLMWMGWGEVTRLLTNLMSGDEIVVGENALAFVMVIVIIVVERLTKEVLNHWLEFHSRR